ncbi:protoporphyrinogen/coproporphyrinogen oxidase [Amycolatopsis magusensis]|uniref:Oxygen-dependent protoporphyrinogen oxidase n=1 Tax=Amycolatopsis magusensis TaxID=882444 RepID=A0ABS4PR12_9PSEU|nr:NAD(P)/FAD-dependent oxidoreductase [Amycolatopsis magusensis]MBP2181862.1 oxygen-dependent protoporphyrinogen oxidase [Amycolatopsis magusensis]
MSAAPDVAVVGAGIAGLTVAHELRRAGLSVRVFEASGEVGGRMKSVRQGGYTIDTGAEQISAEGYRATWELLRRAGIPAADVPSIRRAVGVWRDGRTHLTLSPESSALSLRARWELSRFLLQAKRRRRSYDTDRPEATPLGSATVAEVARGLHRDLHDYLFQPLSANFFGWQADRSAMAPLACLMLAVGPATAWRTYADGMDTLARSLAARLDVETGHPVEQVTTDGTHAQVTTAAGTFHARAAVLCVPAPIAAKLHADPDPAAASFLGACSFTPMLKLSCLLDRPLGLKASRPTYALLTPAAEESVLSGVIVDHEKHASRVPSGRGLVSLCAAPSVAAELIDAPEDDIVPRLLGAGERFLPGLGEATGDTLVHRFRYGLPEATPAALALRAAFEARPIGPVDYAGDWVSLRPSSEGAIRAGALAASRVLRHLGHSRAGVKEAA